MLNWGLRNGRMFFFFGELLPVLEFLVFFLFLLFLFKQSLFSMQHCIVFG
jgi:hypothetical protein